MKSLFQSTIRSQKIELEQFQTRLKARFFLLFIFITQVGQRLFLLLDPAQKSDTPFDFYVTSFPILAILIILVMIEAILYKRKGAQVLRYASMINAIFFVASTAEWLTTLYGGLERVNRCGGVARYSVPSIFSFTSFSWRIMMQIFIIQHWYLRILAPIGAYLMTIIYGIHLNHADYSVILVRGLLQIVYIVFIFYFEEKMNIKLLLTSLHQEKWVQLNEFILNNIPEKIAILNVNGELKFMSDYLRVFLKKFGHMEDIHPLFKNITDLKQQYESDSLNFVHQVIFWDKKFF